MSLALSLCQYVLRSRRGLAQASPGLAQASPSLKAPRLQTFEARDLLHQHNRKGQVVMIKTRRSKRLVFGFVFCTLNWYEFWRRSGGLPCSRPLLPTRCWLVWCWCVSTLEQRSGRRCRGGLKTGPSRRHRIQPAEGPFLGPRAKETCLKKGSESGPAWNQKRSPLEGPVLVPFWPASLWQIYWSVYFKLKLIWPATAAAGILNWGGPFLRACFFLRFEVQKRVPSLSYCFAPISIALRLRGLPWGRPFAPAAA